MRLLRPLAYACVLILGVCSSAWGQANVEPFELTLCELYQHPEEYAGKMVRVRATVAGRSDLWIDAFTREPCPSWIGVIVVFPKQVRPAPDLDLVRDDSLKEFQDALNNKTPIHIDATFEGRFDTVITVQDGKRVRVGKGFGKKRGYDGRIVLHRVSDVWVRPLPQK